MGTCVRERGRKRYAKKGFQARRAWGPSKRVEKKARTTGKAQLGQSAHLLGVNARHLPVLEHVAVDHCCDRRELGDQVHRVLIRGLPVLGLGHACCVLLSKDRLGVQSGYCRRELRHGVQRRRKCVDHVRHVRRDIGPRSPLARESICLRGCRDFSCEEQPEHTLGRHLRATRCRGKLLLAVKERQSPVADSFVRVQNRCLGDQTWDSGVRVWGGCE